MNFEADIWTWDHGGVITFELADADNDQIFKVASGLADPKEDEEVVQIRAIYPSGRKRLIYDYLNGFYFDSVPNE